jgi:dUTP pyrophosphatase
MTKEFLQEELRRVANMMQDPDRFSKEECINTLHSVLEEIPEWKDASILPPSCPLLTIYDNYDDVLIGSLSDQFFTLVHYSKFKNGACCALPYVVAEMGMKQYFDDVVTVEVAEPERRPSFEPAKVRLGFKKLDPDAQLPKYAHDGDAGMDVFALEDSYLEYGTPRIVRTGIAAEIPDGYELQVRARSGLAVKGVEVVNGPGTVDSKYRGEIGVILRFINYHNANVYQNGGIIATRREPERGYEIKKGDKIAQLVLAPVTFADPYEVQKLSTTDRGTGGFGSTGR